MDEVPGAETREAAAHALIGRTLLITSDLTVCGQRQRYKLFVERADVVNPKTGLVHLHGRKLRLDGSPTRRKSKGKTEILAPGWEQAFGVEVGHPEHSDE